MEAPLRTYRQLTSGERHVLSALRKQGLSQAQIARAMRRHPSTISRELRRNARKRGVYRPPEADQKARARRSSHFTREQWKLVYGRLADDWSPQQIAGPAHRASSVH